MSTGVAINGLDRIGRSVAKLVIAGRRVRTLSVRAPLELPWKELGVGVAFECMGTLTRREDLEKHYANQIVREALGAEGA